MDEYTKEERFEEFKKFFYDPVGNFHRYYGEEIPVSANADGYFDSDEVETPPVASYGELEDYVVSTEDNPEHIRRGLEKGNIFVRNNVFLDLDTENPTTTIHRTMINLEDGYTQSSILNGPSLSENKIAPEYLNKDNKPNIIMGTGMYANSVRDIAFNANGLGETYSFFQDRTNIDEYFRDSSLDGTTAISIDSAVNPNLVGIRTRIKDIFAFNNIFAYCNATGIFMPDMAAMIECCIHLSHEVLNLLFPQQIVLVIDSASGCIDIPRKDYIPTIKDPVINIPDYNNKIMHIISIMKMIASRQLFSSRLKNFYLKLTISAPCIIISFISEIAPNQRFMLPISTIDNQILYDCETMKSIYPERYIMTDHWAANRHCDVCDADLLMSMHNDYNAKLFGMANGEIDEFMHAYNIHVTDESFPDDVKNQLSVSEPYELQEFLMPY